MIRIFPKSWNIGIKRYAVSFSQLYMTLNYPKTQDHNFDTRGQTSSLQSLIFNYNEDVHSFTKSKERVASESDERWTWLGIEMCGQDDNVYKLKPKGNFF